MVSPLRYYETGQFYHVYNRGNRRQPIFLSAHDYARFLNRLRRLLRDHRVTLLVYCLMPNHFHFLVRQDEEGAISKLFSRLSTSQAKFINAKYKLDGSLFQQGFQAKRIVDEAHLLHLFRYIHENSLDLLTETLRVEPETLLDRITQYQWSSLSEFLQPEKVLRPLCDTQLMFEVLGYPPLLSLREYLLDDIRQYQLELIEPETLRVTG